MIAAAVLLFCSAALLAVTAVSLADDDVDAEPGGSCPTVPTATVTGSTTTTRDNSTHDLLRRRRTSTTTGDATSTSAVDDYDAVVTALATYAGHRRLRHPSHAAAATSSTTSQPR